MKLLYKPFGIVLGIVAGVVGRKAFEAVWSKIDDDVPPHAKTEGAPLAKVITATALQAAIFAVTRALFDRFGARSFQYLIGAWPGDKKPAELPPGDAQAS